MAYCPFLSGRSDNKGIQNLHSCIATCALHTSQGCALGVIAQAQYDISRKITSKNDK